MTTLEEKAAVATEPSARGIGSFQTHWQAGPPTWHTWETAEELIGAVTAGSRGMPTVRLFDYFSGRSVGFAGAVKLFEHELVRVYAQNPAHRDPYLSRFANFDVIYIQYSGTSTVETEYGPFELPPFHALHVPAGIAHRTIGDADTRRLAVFSRAPIAPVAADLQKCTRTFEVRATGGIEWDGVAPLIDSELDAQNKELEATWLWDDAVDKPLWMERRKGALAGGTTGGREPTLIGIFNYIEGMTGVEKGSMVGPFIFQNANMQMRCYNLEGEQFGFHRGQGSDELWMQLRAGAVNDTEWGKVPLTAGEATNAFPGNAHRINGDVGFLRINLYSERPLRLCVDPLQAVTHTDFSVRETTN